LYRCEFYRWSLHLAKLVSIIGILTFLICFGSSDQSLFGEEKAKEKVSKAVFVDLDGDGFDDNASLDDQTSTIDSAKNAASAISDTTSAGAGFFDLSQL